MRGARAVRLLAVCAVLGGCASSAVDSPPGPGGPRSTESDAGAEGELGGPRDAVLRAAAAVLLDEGYLYTLSDHAAGLVGGERLRGRLYADGYARRGGVGQEPHLVDAVVVWVREVGPGRCAVAVRIWEEGVLVDGPDHAQRSAELVAAVAQRLIADPSAGPHPVARSAGGPIGPAPTEGAR